MKFLFIIQGEGRGHLTQSIALRQMLTEAGHEVAGVMVGKSPSRQLPDFFLRQMNLPVYPFESPNFLPTAKNKQVCLTRSLAYNLFRLPKYLRSMNYIQQVIRESDVDVVVNFYELLTGLTYWIYRPKPVLVCVAHQYLFLHPDFKFPRANRLSLFSLRLFTQVTAIGATKRLALSFRKMREVPQARIVVVPPLLRRELFDMKPAIGNYLHGYLLNSGFSEEIRSWHSQHPAVAMHFFWDKKDAEEETKIDEGLSFHRLDDQLFLRYMAGAKAYATTAGFESVCEAMYLGKPILMVPTHIEQTCNAFDAQQSGCCAVADQFDLDALLAISEQPIDPSAFRHWVQQASWFILREFREDLLYRPDSVYSLWEHLSMALTNRMERLMSHIG
ncbi:MAG: glycosyltransferase family protein [Parabacteroides sp.]